MTDQDDRPDRAHASPLLRHHVHDEYSADPGDLRPDQQQALTELMADPPHAAANSRVGRTHNLATLLDAAAESGEVVCKVSPAGVEFSSAPTSALPPVELDDQGRVTPCSAHALESALVERLAEDSGETLADVPTTVSWADVEVRIGGVPFPRTPEGRRVAGVVTARTTTRILERRITNTVRFAEPLAGRRITRQDLLNWGACYFADPRDATPDDSPTINRFVPDEGVTALDVCDGYAPEVPPLDRIWVLAHVLPRRTARKQLAVHWASQALAENHVRDQRAWRAIHHAHDEARGYSRRHACYALSRAERAAKGTSAKHAILASECALYGMAFDVATYAGLAGIDPAAMLADVRRVLLGGAVG